MQLSRVLTRAGKAMWLLLLVPIVAIAATTAYLWNAPPDVHTSATISVIAPEGQSTAATITQAVDGFKSAVVSETVAQLAADDAGANVDISHDLTVERVGTSNLVEMQLTTEPGEDGNALIRALVARTNDALFASTTASAEAAISQAQDNYDKAIADRDDAIEESGYPIPIEAYRSKASEVTQLRVALVVGDASVDKSVIQAKLTAANKELTQIGQSVNSFDNIQDQVIRSRSDLANANSDLDSVETRQQAASADESITVSASQKQSARTTMVRGAVAAAVVGLALGGGLVLLIGLLRGPRKGGRSGGKSGKPGKPSAAKSAA